MFKPAPGDSLESQSSTATSNKRYNGFTLYSSDVFKNKVQEAGETKEECRHRVLRFCRESWKARGPEGDALRRHWQLKAISANHEFQSDSQTSALVPTPRERKDTYMCPLTAYDGVGPLGIGDRLFGISQNSVREADASSSFVTNYSTAWRHRTGVPLDTRCTDPQGSTKLSCYETFGFCRDSIVDFRMFTKLCDHLVNFVRAYRQQHVVSGRNRGPNSQLQIPLLLSAKPLVLG